MKLCFKFLICLSLSGVFISPLLSQERVKEPAGNEIVELVTPVELGQKIENLDYFLPISSFSGIQKDAVYTNPQESPAERALDVIARLTFEEKLKLTGGWSFMYFPAIERLGLRPVVMVDASQGIRMKAIVTKGKSTSFPSLLAVAASWNTTLAGEFGKAIGEECRALGVDVMLGPGLNMQRFSVSGRNFEYMGEDPFLAANIAKSYVKGLPDPIVKGGQVEVWDRPGLGVEFNVKAAKQFLPEEDKKFFD